MTLHGCVDDLRVIAGSCIGLTSSDTWLGDVAMTAHSLRRWWRQMTLTSTASHWTCKVSPFKRSKLKSLSLIDQSLMRYIYISTGRTWSDQPDMGACRSFSRGWQNHVDWQKWFIFQRAEVANENFCNFFFDVLRLNLRWFKVNIRRWRREQTF